MKKILTMREREPLRFFSKKTITTKASRNEEISSSFKN
jgi:hypothetical protein